MERSESHERHPTEVWLDEFFEAYYRRRPINATFIGVHDHDHDLPDVSEAGLADALSETRHQLETSANLVSGLDLDSRSGATPAVREHLDLDLKLARGFLRTQEWELGSAHGPVGNPSLVTGEGVFALLSLFLSDFAPLEERVASVAARMSQLPGFLATARSHSTEAPPEWTARAARECAGAIAFLTTGLDTVAGLGASARERLRGPARTAARAFSDHEAYLAGKLAAANGEPQKGSYGCGEEALALHFREAHFLARTPEQLAEWARAELKEAAGALRAGAEAVGFSNPDEALEELNRLHPTATTYYDRYQELWDASRQTAVEHQLLTWPDFPIRYVPRPEWARAAAPHLYFLFYRSPAAFARPPVHEYLVTPIESHMEPSRRDRLLQANNDSVIKLNHVVHHGGVGHHVQNWHAFRSGSRVGQVAAVDCASRIAMNCGGTMAEGWACYATDLMREHGFLTPLEELAELRSRTRMCARAVVDVELHSGRFSLDDATNFYVREAGMSLDGARSEAVKNSMFPAGAVMYLAGTDRIHELRREMRRASGPAFTLREFHDAFLSHGSVPVTLIADRMLSSAPPPAHSNEVR